ncbi:MAG: transposase [Nitrospirales bacterium]|nr:MAG: transposase [Nitrospirales bacterium]
MCRLLRVSSGGYYARQTRPQSQRATRNAQLVQAIHRIHTESDAVYGSPKVWRELQGQGQSCGKQRVARLMKQAGLQGIPAKKRWRTRKVGARPAGVTNQLARDFAAATPNTKWVTDITYIRTAEGWLYLAVVLDLFSRQVIGWSMQPHLGRELAIQAVLMAVGRRTTSSEVVLHSDRGTQYTADDYQAFLRTHGIVSSMSGVGNCYDNAVAESFFGLLKRERINRRRYQTRAEARTDVFDYIERFYNRQRRHSYSKGLSPDTYAKQHVQTLN